MKQLCQQIRSHGHCGSDASYMIWRDRIGGRRKRAVCERCFKTLMAALDGRDKILFETIAEADLERGMTV